MARLLYLAASCLAISLSPKLCLGMTPPARLSLRLRLGVIRLVRSDFAAAVPEYVLIVGAIVAVVLAGTVLLGGQLREVFVGTSASFPVVEVTPRPARTSASVSNAEPSQVSTVLRAKHVWASSVLLVAAGVMAVTAGLSRRKRRPVVQEDAVEPRLHTAADIDLDGELGARRQQILRTLLADTSLLTRSRILVGHLMNRRFETVLSSLRGAELLEVMRQRKSNFVLVADSDGRFAGIAGQRAATRNPQLAARELLSEDLRTTSPEAPVSVAISTLVGVRQTCLPVLEDGRLCGTITMTDLVLTLQASLQMFLRLAQFLQVEERQAPATSDRHDPLQSPTGSEIQSLREQIARFRDHARHTDPRTQVDELQRAVESCRQLAERVNAAERRLDERYERLAAAFELRVDPLTGFACRRAVEERIEQQLQLAQRYGQAGSLLLAVTRNATDESWEELARFVQNEMRATDFGARFDRDALLILLPGTTVMDAQNLAERLRLPLPRVRFACVAVEPGQTTAYILQRLDAASATTRNECPANGPNP